MDWWALVAVLAWPIGMFLWTVYDHRIAPLFIPAAEIEAQARALVQLYGDVAAEVALGEADHEWHSCYLQRSGWWRRVAKRCAEISGPSCDPTIFEETCVRVDGRLKAGHDGWGGGIDT